MNFLFILQIHGIIIEQIVIYGIKKIRIKEN